MAVTLSISLSESNISQANNTSDVTAVVYAHSTQGSWSGNQRPGYVVIDGTQYNFSSSFAANVTTELYRTTKTVQHDPDGKKTVASNAFFSTGVSSGDITATASIDLTTIQRNSVITGATDSDDIQKYFEVSFTKYENYTHTLKVYNLDLTLRTMNNLTDSPIRLTLTDDEVLSLMEHWNVEAGIREQVGFELKTFDGDTQIGGSSWGVGYIDIKGTMAYDDGTNMKLGIPYYDTGTEWKRCIAKYDDGAVWK